MNIIKTVNSKRFSLNGIEYLKNYVTEVVGSRIEIFNCYDRCDVLVPLTHYNQFTVNGVAHSTIAQLQAALLDVLYSRATLGTAMPDIDQDNIDIVCSIRLTTFSMANILTALNTGAAFTVGDKQSLWVVVNLTRGLFRTGGVYKYKVMKAGKGDYGPGGTPLAQSNLELVYYSAPNLQDTLSLPETLHLNFGSLINVTPVTWLNTQSTGVALRLAQQGDTVFSGTVNGVERHYAWVGTAGTYGAKELQATESDIEEITLLYPQLNGYDSALEQGNETERFAVHKDDQSDALTSYGHIIKHLGNGSNETVIEFDEPIANITYHIPAKPADDTFAMKSDIKQDLPKDLIVSCTYDQVNRGNFPVYLTDAWHRLPIQQYTGISVYAAYSVAINGNDIIFHLQETDRAGNNAILVLKDCYINENIIHVGSHEYRALTEVPKDANNEPYILASMLLSPKGDYVYLSSRQTVSGNFDNSNTQFFKINAHNVNDFKVYELPLGGNFQGYTANINFNEGYIYFLMGTYTTGAAWMCRIDENLTAPEALFQTGTVTTERLVNSCPFEISRGEIYIPTIWNTVNGMNTIGLQVWDLSKKVLNRKVQQITISTDATTTPSPHSVNIYNGTVIFHTATGGGGNMKLIRFDAFTLALEEVFPLLSKHGSAESFDSEGWLYINPEMTIGVQGYRYRYDNFAISEQLILPEGTPYYYSTGSPRYYPEKSALKTNLSQYYDDLSVVRTVNGLAPDAGGNFVMATAANTPLIVASKAGLSASVVGSIDSTAEKILATIVVPANTITKGILAFDAAFSISATGVNAVKNLRLRTNTSNTLSGAAILAVGQATATARYVPFARRIMNITGTAIRAFGATAVSEAVTSTAITNVAFNPAITNYFFFTGTVTNAADDITLENFMLTNIKEI